METVQTAHVLDGADIQMPVQFCFKDRQPNGAHLEVLLRRVKAGNEVECEDVFDSGFASHYKGKFSDAQTLLRRFDDAVLKDHAAWIPQVTEAILAQMAVTVRQQPALVKLFAPKGKIEIYGPGTPSFTPLYISGNFTLKLHVDHFVNPHPTGNVLAHLIAQHLDYPFGPGERRFSTSRLFDMCFAAEKVIAPNGLAASIDAALEQRGIYQPARHELSDKDHVTTLLKGHSAAIRTSYERVLQRERFAAFIVELYGKRNARLNAPILSAYRQLVEVALAVHTREEFKNYPPKTMDDMAEAIHVPLMMVFNKASNHEHKRKRCTSS